VRGHHDYASVLDLGLESVWSKSSGQIFGGKFFDKNRLRRRVLRQSAFLCESEVQERRSVLRHYREMRRRRCCWPARTGRRPSFVRIN